MFERKEREDWERNKRNVLRQLNNDIRYLLDRPPPKTDAEKVKWHADFSLCEALIAMIRASRYPDRLPEVEAT
jgi:hypothetical protein